MKFSSDTLTVMKNFATINPSLAFDQGNVLRTMSPNKTILAQATITDNIERDFAIYDLSRFLGVLSMFTDPDIQLGDRSLTIESNTRNVRYTYADRSTFIVAPTKNLKLPSEDVQFELSADVLNEVKSALGVMSLPELAVVGEDGKMMLRAFDSKNPSTNTFDVTLADAASDFTAVFRTENLKILPRDYNVTISKAGISNFVCTSSDLQYWLSIESNSNFE